MKKTDVKKTERSKEFLAEEWLEIVLKGQDKGEGRFCRVKFYGKTAINISAGKEKTGIGKAIYRESNYGKSNHEKSVQGDAEQLVRTGRTGQ